MTKIFVPPFYPIYGSSNLSYPVIETNLLPKEREVDGSLGLSRTLMIESKVYDQSGKITNSQNYTMEVWA